MAERRRLVTVGVAAVRDGRLVVVRRAAGDEILPGRWEMPGGSVEPGETMAAGAARELAEETGLAGRVVGAIHAYDFASLRPHRAGDSPLIAHVVFLVALDADPVEVVLSAEHDRSRWVTAAADLDGVEMAPEQRDAVGVAVAAAERHGLVAAPAALG